LKSFNLPYQLGFSDIPEFKGTFESPNDADTASIALLPGDIIVLATDGLYDNLGMLLCNCCVCPSRSFTRAFTRVPVDLHEIVEEISKWEQEWFPSIDGSEIQKHSDKGADAIQALSKRLVMKAREYSLDSNRDSPFAVLAKENDIMWGGGMPDDTTVIVARVFNGN
jgi:protein phosphatase PTC7